MFGLTALRTLTTDLRIEMFWVFPESQRPQKFVCSLNADAPPLVV